MRYLMMPVFKLIPGMSHSIDKGAGRYLEVAAKGDDVSGHFFASKAKKMTGPLHVVDMDHLNRPAERKALWNVTARVAGDVGYPANA